MDLISALILSIAIQVKNNFNRILDYNTNQHEEKEINKIKSKMINNNISKIIVPNRIDKSNGIFKVSEFDANIEENDGHNGDIFKHNQKLTFNTSFQFCSQREKVPAVKSHPKQEENKNDNPQPEQEYLSLETSAKDFCCSSSRNSKCLIY